jgi:hypothetical protein
VKKMILFVFMILLSQSFNAEACDDKGKSGFMPENNMSVAVGDKAANDMTETRFNAIIDRVESVYAPIVRGKKGRLVVKRKWKDNTVNASASRLFRTWTVNMYGGLARHPDVTDDGFALVICHELGHHLGGAPKVGNLMMKWASNEGQSDYFGSLKCMRRVFGNDDNTTIISTMKVPAHAEKKCLGSWSTQADQALCIRIAMAGKSLSKLLARSGTPQFSTPDTSVVSRTNNTHPAGQCRLDTYFHGALCDKEVSDDVSNRDRTKGVCARTRGYREGTRPLCWYKP